MGFCLAARCSPRRSVTSRRKAISAFEAQRFLATLTISKMRESSNLHRRGQVHGAGKAHGRRGYSKAPRWRLLVHMLRANDLIGVRGQQLPPLTQSISVRSALLGTPIRTRNARGHAQLLLRNMYLRNLLGNQAARIERNANRSRPSRGAALLISTHTTTCTMESCYAGARLFPGAGALVLRRLGPYRGHQHPPSANKYGYSTHEALGADPETWRSSAIEHAGSWWSDWEGWSAGHGGALIPARTPGSGALAAIEDAPGSYVSVRATESKK